MKTREKSFLNIKSKLTAAVAMLLVAFFMVISSSYAWFTLSTAPEVTGITTTVGANGNLEIALLTGTDAASNASLTAAAAAVKNGFVGTAALPTTSNTYWGNLVTLKDSNGNDLYGLSTISLLPSRLDAGDSTDDDFDWKINNYAPLLVPTYGSDGRIESLTNSGTVQTGVYTSNNFTKSGLGVRGLGTQSTMTQQELDYRVATQAVSRALSNAASVANTALSDNAQALTDLLVGYATGAAKFDLTAVNAMLTALNGTGFNGVVNYLETAKEEIVKAIYASYMSTQQTAYVTPSDVTVTVTGDATAGYNVSASVTLEGSATPVTVDLTTYTAFTSFCAKVADITANLAAATTAYSNVAGDKTKADWDTTYGILKYLLDVNGAVTLGGKTVTEIRTATDGKNQVEKIDWVTTNCMSNGSVTVVLGDGSGIFADVHAVTKTQIKAQSLYANLITIYIQTGATRIDVVIREPQAGSNASTNLTDLYGYALDFAFRTNATGSNLLLSDVANRIYSNSTNEETMGHGSVMKFSSSDPSFQTTSVANLMGCIRVIFTDVDGNIVAVGAADRTITSTTTSEGGNAVTTYEESNVNATVSGMEVTANIVLFDFTFVDGELILTGKKSTNAIMALSQNTATVLSAYVYLDGDKVENADVATGASSMTGSINLQFASDAELTPMDYADLKGQTTTTSTTATTAATN